MANKRYFIGGVATVSAFEATNGNIQHLFDAKTLTDSSINVSVSAEEIRGGEGAALLGKYFHTTVFNLSLTDALLDMNYIAKQVGNDLNKDVVSYGMANVTVTFDSTTYKATFKQSDINGSVAALSFGDLTRTMGWDKNSNAEYDIYTAASGETYDYYIQGTAAQKGESICLVVPIGKTGDQVKVKAMYQPGIMSLIMRAKLFEGDACSSSNGTAVGELVIEVPKFQLDGTIDLAMAMTSPATYALNGSALAAGCDCEGNSWYAKITEVINSDTQKYSGYNQVIIDADSLAVGSVLAVYATNPGSILTPIKIDLTNLSGSTGSYTSDNFTSITGTGLTLTTATAATTTNPVGNISAFDNTSTITVKTKANSANGLLGNMTDSYTF